MAYCLDLETDSRPYPQDMAQKILNLIQCEKCKISIKKRGSRRYCPACVDEARAEYRKKYNKKA